MSIYDIPGTTSFTAANNIIHVCGKLIDSLKFDRESYGEKFYNTKISIQRSSGCYDELPISVSERFIKDNTEYKGKFVVIDGQVRI